VPELAQELRRAPTVPEMAKRTGMSEDDVLEAMKHRRRTRPIRSMPDVRGRTTVCPRRARRRRHAARADGRVGQRSPRARANAAREKRILYLRFFEDRTQTEIAEEIGISQMHVSRCWRRTLSFSASMSAS